MPNQSQIPKRKSSAPAEGAEKRPRTRVSRACDQCRTAREKCDGIQPVCFTCQASNRKCSYTVNPKKRGIQPGYIRTLELSLSWIFNNFPESEPGLSKILEREGASSVLFGKDTTQSNKLHKKWRRSRFCKDINKLLSNTSGHDDCKSTDSDDEDSDVADTSNSLEEAYTYEPAFSFPNSVEVSNHTSQPQPTLHGDSTFKKIRLPAQIWHLFEVYFVHSQCWLPISEKPDVLKTSYSYSDGLDLSPDMAQAEDHAEMWSILALASLQDTSERDVRDIPGNDEPRDPERLYTIARHLIPFEQGAFELGHVKALLNLAQVNLFRCFPQAALLLVGHASRILAVMKIKENAKSSRFKHTYAACYVLDTIISMQLDCRAYIQGSDIEALGKIEENGLEEWQFWAPCIEVAKVINHSTGLASQKRSPVLALSIFNQLCALVHIMGYSQIRIPSQSSQEVAYQLKEWQTSLPGTFDYIRNGYLAVPATPPSLLLLLAYYCCAATLNYPPRQSVQNIIGLLERARDTIGFEALPAITQSFLDVYVATHTFQALDQGSKIRFQIARDELTKTWQRLYISRPLSSVPGNTSEFIDTLARSSVRASNIQIPTPQSLQAPLHSRITTTNDNLTTDMDFISDPSLQSSTSTRFHPSYIAVPEQPNLTSSQNLESFFDELASLDGVGGMDNQPQFMQNLGYAPDADIADLLAPDFGQFDPLQPTFTQNGNTGQMSFP